MLKQDIIKLFITKNGINKNIINEITKCDMENFESLFNFVNLIEKEIFEIEDNAQTQEVIDIFYENKNNLFKIGIFNMIKNISEKKGNSIKEEFLHQKTVIFFNIIKNQIKKNVILIVFLQLISFCIISMYAERYLGALYIFLLILLIALLAIVSYMLCSLSDKKIQKQSKSFHILCQIENEIFN